MYYTVMLDHQIGDNQPCITWKMIQRLLTIAAKYLTKLCMKKLSLQRMCGGRLFHAAINSEPSAVCDLLSPKCETKVTLASTQVMILTGNLQMDCGLQLVGFLPANVDG